MNPYNMNITNTVNTLRGTVAEEIEKNTDWELFGQNVASFLYQTGMSIGDSALQVGTLGRAATLFMGGSAAGGVISGGVMGGVTDGVNWAGNATSQNGTAMGSGQVAVDSRATKQKTVSQRETVKADTTLFNRKILANLNQARKTLIQFAKANFPGVVQNLETGKTIKISRNGLDKFLSGRLPYEKYATRFHIPELVEKAHKVGEATDVKGRAEILGYEYYESPITVDEKEYMAYIRVRETKSGDSYYGHTIGEIEDIKIEPSARVDTQDVSQPVYAIDDSTFNSIIPQTGDSINKKYAEKGAEYTEKPESRLDMGIQASKSPDSQPSLISDQALNELMNDQSFLDFLKRKGDLKLTKDMTRDRKRTAIREALGRAVQKKNVSKPGLEKPEGNDILEKINPDALLHQMGGLTDGRGEEGATGGVPGSEVPAGTSAQDGDRSGVQETGGGVQEGLSRQAIHGSASGGLTASFGQQPVKSWAKDTVITPPEGSIVQGEQQVAGEFYIPSYVIQDESGDQTPDASIHQPMEKEEEWAETGPSESERKRRFISEFTGRIRTSICSM